MPNESNLPAGPAASGSGFGPGYEVRDTSVRAIVVFLIGLTLFVVVVQVVLWGMLGLLSADNPNTTVTLTPIDVIGQQRRALTAREEAALGEKAYGPVDPSKPSGPVRIPVDTAIDLLSERGIAPVAPARAIDVNSHAGKPAPPDMKGQGPAPSKAQGSGK